MPSEARLREPWASFLDGLDSTLSQTTELHCLGGFVVSELYGLERPTADVDVLDATKGTDAATLARLAGKGSPLHTRYKVYVDIVTVATVPEEYESRLIDWRPGRLQKLRLRVLERHDLVLAKLARNVDKDLEDLKRIALHAGLDVNVLRERYTNELRFQLGRPESGDVTLQLWVDVIKELA